MEGKIIRRVGQRLAMSWAALVMCAAVSGQDGTSTTPDKQPPTPAEAVPEQLVLRFPLVKPLPIGQTKPLTALVINVKRNAEWRPSDKAEWKPAKVNDQLHPGAQIRTAGHSSITLRTGNATMLVDRYSRVDVPVNRLVGSQIYTYFVLPYGIIRIKIDKSPTDPAPKVKVLNGSASVSVRGTGFAVRWGALEGLEIEALATNVIHAIEVRYLLTNRSYYLSGPGATRENQPNPVEVAFEKTIVPTIPGELTDGEFLAELQDLRRVDYSRIGLAATLDFVSSFKREKKLCISLAECAAQQREMDK